MTVLSVDLQKYIGDLDLAIAFESDGPVTGLPPGEVLTMAMVVLARLMVWLMAGDEYAGCSVHLVTADLDDGPVLMQQTVRILPRDDVDSLAARVLEAEHELYPRALEDYCSLIGRASLPRLPDRS